MWMLSSHLQRRLRTFRRDRSGVAAVEFAIVLPLLLTIYFGVVEVTQGVVINRKVTLTTRTVADLVTQVSKVTPADLTDILDASRSVMSPYPTGTLKIIVSAITVDANGAVKVEFSRALNTAARVTGSTVTLPAALKVNNTQIVLSEVAYDYTPTIGYVLSGTLPLKDQMYMRARLGEKVLCEGC